jgi:hypothetical protein
MPARGAMGGLDDADRYCSFFGVALHLHGGRYTFGIEITNLRIDIHTATTYHLHKLCRKSEICAGVARDTTG